MAGRAITEKFMGLSQKKSGAESGEIDLEVVWIICRSLACLSLAFVACQLRHQPLGSLDLARRKHWPTEHLERHIAIAGPELHSAVVQQPNKPTFHRRNQHSTMPTPESEAFLAKKPTVPPTFDGVDYDDTKRLKQAQDAIIREQWVQVMMGRLVREELSKCYYREGVNHLEKCGRLRG